MRTPMMRDALTKPNCEVQVNNWVIPTAVAGVAGFASGMFVRSLLKNDADSTRHAFGYIAETTTFMLVGGFVWAWMARRPKGDLLDY